MRLFRASALVRTLIAAGAAAIAVWAAWCVVRGHVREAYRRGFAAQGFPRDYARLLVELRLGHPNWRFSPLPVTDMTWDEIVEKESSPSWNLVAYSRWSPEEWAHLGTTNYTPYYARNARAYDSGAWYQASREAIAYFMDPRNWLNEREIFMFETLGYDAGSHTREAVERTLAGTFMANANYDGGTNGFSALVADVGRRLGVNPVFLAGRLASEQGSGSAQAFGTIGDALAAYATNRSDRIGSAVIWGKTYTRDGARTRKALARGRAAYNGFYNFFNFRACGLGLFEIKYNAWAEATSKETRERYLGPWNTQARAIEGGSIKIKERYIDTHRHTRYLQKFSVLAEAADYRWKQYMQNIAAPLVEARNTAKAYAAAGALDAPCRFLIPVYREMPKNPCPDPAKGNSIYSSLK